MRVQDEWAILQKKAIGMIRESGIDVYEEICSETGRILSDGAVWKDGLEYMDHHMAGPSCIVQGERYLSQSDESIAKATDYLRKKGVI